MHSAILMENSFTSYSTLFDCSLKLTNKCMRITYTTPDTWMSQKAEKSPFCTSKEDFTIVYREWNRSMKIHCFYRITENFLLNIEHVKIAISIHFVLLLLLYLFLRTIHCLINFYGNRMLMHYFHGSGIWNLEKRIFFCFTKET